MLRCAFVFLFAAACRNAVPPIDEDEPVDLDQDGYVREDDCDDLDAGVHPGAEEHCDGVDEDCDAQIDEDAVDPYTVYVDGDGDGFGAGAAVVGCATEGLVADDSDCNDDDDTVHPGAGERCGEPDEDCDGLVDHADPDLDVSTGDRFFLDRDRDGYGTALFVVFSCEQPVGTATIDGDCDDLVARVNPDATETCNERDDDCDEQVDDADDTLDVTTTATFYADLDLDGFGAGEPVRACERPEGTTLADDDCNDDDDAIHPGADEICNDLDDDCDTRVDDDDPLLDTATATRWWADRDGDGHGGRWFSMIACDPIAGLAPDGDDCDDDDPAISPSAVEICNERDDDCDQRVDDDDDTLDVMTGSPWHPDADGDHWGAGDATTWACLEPEGFGTDTSDCDDDDDAVHPGAVEICNAIDDDCDDHVDDEDDDLGPETASYWVDADHDGWGTPDRWACEDFGFGWADQLGDCDDGRDTVHPEADEVCDGRDNDCDHATDGADAVDAVTWYVDDDGDDYGSESTVKACTRPNEATSNPGDCDDGQRFVNPGATEVCDGVDNDCDRVVDLDTFGLPQWYVDGDGDTWGEPGTGMPACAAFDGRVSREGDCDDLVSAVNPGVAEVDGDHVDNDCDGKVDLPTVIPGRLITSDETWGDDDPFIEVDGNVLVASGATLTIAPCTQILFGPGRGLQVEGTLIARGTADCRIRFTSKAEDPAPGDWARVIFTSTSVGATVSGTDYVSGSILEHVDILYGGGLGYGLQAEGASGAPYLSHVRVSYSAGAGIYVPARLPYLGDCEVSDNGNDGMLVTQVGTAVRNVALRNGGTGMDFRPAGSSPLLVQGNEAWYNDGTGIDVNNSGPWTVLDNVAVGNNGAGIDTSNVRSTLRGNLAVDNDVGIQTGVGSSGETIVEYNVVVGNRYGFNIDIGFSGTGLQLRNNTIVGNEIGAQAGGRTPFTMSGNLLQGQTSTDAWVLRLPTQTQAAATTHVNGNAWIGPQPSDWLNVGFPSGSPFIDVESNWWDGLDENGARAHVRDFLVDPAYTVADIGPVLTALSEDVPVSYPQGVEAVWVDDAVLLVWDDNPETDLLGYRVWYGLDGELWWAMAGTGAVEGDSPVETTEATATITGLDPAMPWRFAVTALDGDAAFDGTDLVLGHESWPSPLVVATP